MNDTERQLLRRLRDAASNGVPRSQVPVGCANLIRALATCGAAEYRPAPRGRGFVLGVADGDAFRRFVDAQLPGGLDVIYQSIPDRAAAIAMLADAKTARHGIAQVVLARAWKPGVTLTGDRTEELCVTQLTQNSGAACIQLSATVPWTFAGKIAVIENDDAFWEAELALPEIDLAILARGRMSNRLIEWLGSEGIRECQILHWGDYDPVGVCEFVRLVEAYPDRVDTFAPTTIEQLLPRFGKRELVTKQTASLDKLRRIAQRPHVVRMVGLFDMHRRGLEQELLLHLDRNQA